MPVISFGGILTAISSLVSPLLSAQSVRAAFFFLSHLPTWQRLQRFYPGSSSSDMFCVLLRRVFLSFPSVRSRCSRITARLAPLRHYPPPRPFALASRSPRARPPARSQCGCARCRLVGGLPAVLPFPKYAYSGIKWPIFLKIPLFLLFYLHILFFCCTFAAAKVQSPLLDKNA